MGEDKGGVKSGPMPVEAIDAVKEEAPTKGAHELPVNKCIVHPLVLLSVVDHFNRMGKIGNQKRVVGILLGSMKQNRELDISNSFAGKKSNSNNCNSWK